MYAAIPMSVVSIDYLSFHLWAQSGHGTPNTKDNTRKIEKIKNAVRKAVPVKLYRLRLQLFMHISYHILGLLVKPRRSI